MTDSPHLLACGGRIALVGAAVLGAWAAPTAAQVGRAEAIRVGENVRAAAPTDDRSFAEVHLAIHPTDARRLLAVAMVVPRGVPWKDRAARQTCAALRSDDGGRHWARADLPVTNCYDPWVTFTPDGHAVVALLGTHRALPQHPDELLVLHSPDGGVTWDSLPTALGRGHDHPTLAADPGSPGRRGWVYVLSGQDVRADAGRLRFSVFVARSRPNGRTFDAPVRVIPSNLHVLPEMPVVLSDGTLVVSYVDGQWNVDNTWTNGGELERRRGWTLRSTDGGTTFSMPLFATEACGPPGFQLSALVADHSTGPFRDRLYFACRRHGGGALMLSASGDAEQWTAPVRVHTAPVDTAVIREMPALAVNGAGVLGVAWVDTRQEPGGVPAQHCSAVYFTASHDGGRTFLPEQRVSSERSCPDSARNQGSWLLGGDYFGMVAAPDGTFRLLWADARDEAHGAALGRGFALWTATVTVDATADGRHQPQSKLSEAAKKDGYRDTRVRIKH